MKYRLGLFAWGLAVVLSAAMGCGNEVPTSGDDSVFVAAEKGDISTVRFALTREAFGVNTPDNNGKTLLHHAVIGNQPAVIEMLVDERGADVSIQDEEGRTAMAYAEEAGNAEVVSYLKNAAGQP